MSWSSPDLHPTVPDEPPHGRGSEGLKAVIVKFVVCAEHLKGAEISILCQ